MKTHQKIAYALLSLLAPTAYWVAADSYPSELKFDLSSTLLVMGRDYGAEVKGSAASASVSIAAKSQLSEQATFGIKSVLVENLWEDERENAAYWLSNDKSASLPEAYISYRAAGLGPNGTLLSLGRKELTYSFFPAYKVRHQAQSLEGIFAHARISESLKVDLGHIERYSSWPSRENGTSLLDTSFKRLGERIGASETKSGIQFVSTELNKKSFSLHAYDYYAEKLYNNAGLKLSYTLPTNSGDGHWSLSAHGIDQKGQGDGAFKDHSASSLELNLRYKLNSFSLDTGWTQISKDASLLVPFRTSYTNDATLLWYTNQFEAGTQTYHAKAVYSRNSWTLAAVYLTASHLDRRAEIEIDLVAKRKLSEKLSVCVKAGYGKCVFDEADRHHKSARDLRLFVDYRL